MTSGARGKGKGQIKKLKLKKETLKDLDVKRTAKKVKGGVIIELSHMDSCAPVCTMVALRPACTPVPASRVIEAGERATCRK